MWRWARRLFTWVVTPFLLFVSAIGSIGLRNDLQEWASVVEGLPEVWLRVIDILSAPWLTHSAVAVLTILIVRTFDAVFFRETRLRRRLTHEVARLVEVLKAIRLQIGFVRVRYGSTELQDPALVNQVQTTPSQEINLRTKYVWKGKRSDIFFQLWNANAPQICFLEVPQDYIIAFPDSDPGVPRVWNFIGQIEGRSRYATLGTHARTHSQGAWVVSLHVITPGQGEAGCRGVYQAIRAFYSRPGRDL